MKILHLSDLHFQENHEKKFIKYFNLLLNELEEDFIDLLIFSGDLVDKKGCDLQTAYSFFSNSFVQNLKNKDIKIYFCCGNHDIDRRLISQLFKNFIDDLKNEEDLYNFIINNDNNDFTNNLKHINEYNELVKLNFPPNKTLYNLVDFYFFPFSNNKNISVVSLNLSWLSYNEDNYGKLWFCENILDEITNEIKSYDFKILLIHQPLRFLHQSIFKSFTSKIYRSFDCIFSGHTHQEEISAIINSTGGILNCGASSISDVYSIKYPIGSTLLNIDLDTFQVSYKSFEYNKSIDKVKSILIDDIFIPVDKEKRLRIKIFNTLLNKKDSIIDEANTRFIPSFNEDVNFTDLFTFPIIRKEILNLDIKVKDEKVKKAKNIEYKDLLNDESSIIFGKDKSGKSSLLYILCIDFIKNISVFRIIPIIVDMSFYYNNNDNLNIKNIIKAFYNLSNVDLEFIISNYKIKFLLDNFKESEKEINSNFFNELSNLLNFSFTVTCQDSHIDSSCLDIIPTQNELHIHDITKRKIREITEKWPITGNYNKDDIVEKLTTIFKQLNIHFNFWTVSLFLWIFEKTGSVNLHNNVELIDLYVENLLEKSNLVLSLQSQTFSYENYREFLAKTAYFLYSSRENNNYSCTYTDLIKLFDQYSHENIRVVADSRDIIDYILRKGIIIRKEIDNYTFRLNGVFEYFLARHMLSSPTFKENVINNCNTFLSFKNELEIYSGFNRSDSELLIQLYFNTINAHNLLIKKISSFDDNEIDFSKSDSKIFTDLQEVIKDIKDQIKPLTYDQKDEIEDNLTGDIEINSEVHAKLTYNIDDIDSDLYLMHLSILSRVFRNLDRINDTDTIFEILNFIVEQTCYAIVFALEELLLKFKNNAKNQDKMEELIDFFRSFSPLFIHTFLFDELAHPTLENLIFQKVADLKSDYDHNQLLIFIYYFLLIEFDPYKYRNLIDELIDNIKSHTILYSIFTKLILYVAFKCNGKEHLEKELHKELEKVYKKLFPTKKRVAKDNVNTIFKQLKDIENS